MGLELCQAFQHQIIVFFVHGIEEVQELLVDGLVFIRGLGGDVFGAAVAVCRRLLFCWCLPHWLSCILSGIFRILWLYKPYSLKPILLHRIRVFLPVDFL